MRAGRLLDRALRHCAAVVHVAAMLPGVVTAAGLIAAAPQPATGDVEEWLRLLREHQVGVLDNAARQVSGWDWSRLQPVLQELHRHAHPTVVLRSAALLSDIAFEIPSDQRRLANLAGGTVLADDGRVQGAGRLDGHLAAARQLLDALPRSGSLDAARVRAHAAAWYRTVSAVLASTHNLADLEPHVTRAVERFPDDAGILFEAGCFYETFASPLTQIPLAEETARAMARAPLGLIVQPRPAVRMLVEAEKHFRRAGDPALARAALERVFESAGDSGRDDPWFRYLRGSGRDNEAARRAFDDRVRALPLPGPDARRVR